MRVRVNGTESWFDVDGLGMVPDGPRMRHRPTVVIVHGTCWDVLTSWLSGNGVRR